MGGRHRRDGANAEHARAVRQSFKLIPWSLIPRRAVITTTITCNITRRQASLRVRCVCQLPRSSPPSPVRCVVSQIDEINRKAKEKASNAKDTAPKTS